MFVFETSVFTTEMTISQEFETISRCETDWTVILSRSFFSVFFSLFHLHFISPSSLVIFHFISLFLFFNFSYVHVPSIFLTFKRVISFFIFVPLTIFSPNLLVVFLEIFFNFTRSVQVLICLVLRFCFIFLNFFNWK